MSEPDLANLESKSFQARQQARQSRFIAAMNSRLEEVQELQDLITSSAVKDYTLLSDICDRSAASFSCEMKWIFDRSIFPSLERTFPKAFISIKLELLMLLNSKPSPSSPTKHRAKDLHSRLSRLRHLASASNETWLSIRCVAEIYRQVILEEFLGLQSSLKAQQGVKKSHDQPATPQGGSSKDAASQSDFDTHTQSAAATGAESSTTGEGSKSGPFLPEYTNRDNAMQSPNEDFTFSSGSRSSMHAATSKPFKSTTKTIEERLEEMLRDLQRSD